MIEVSAEPVRPLEDCGSVSISTRSCLLCLDVGSQKNSIVISFGFEASFIGLRANSPETMDIGRKAHQIVTAINALFWDIFREDSPLPLDKLVCGPK